MDQVTICNMAISLTGQGKPISDILGKEPAAVACNLHYVASLFELLGEFYWNWATKTAPLTLVTQTQPDPAGLQVTIPWVYQYAYPGDCLNFIGVLSGFPKDTLFTIVEHRIVYQDQQQTIFCNMPNALGEYVVMALDPTRYPAAFVKALYYLLAAKISPSLTQKEAKTNQLLQLYGIFRDKAIATDLKEAKKLKPRNSAAQDARGGSGWRNGAPGWPGSAGAAYSVLG